MRESLKSRVLVFAAIATICAMSPAQPQTVAVAQSNCNAFDEWAKLNWDKMPRAPATLQSALVEGKRLPPDESQLFRRQQAIAPYDEGIQRDCRCSVHSDRFDKVTDSGEVDLKAVSDVNLVLSQVEQSRQLKVKQLLAQGRFLEVPVAIRRVFDIPRVGAGGKRV